MSQKVSKIWLMQLFFEIFSLISGTWIITRSKILEGFRNKLNFYMIRCDQCTGFWMGLLGSLYFEHQIKEIILISLSTSGLGFISSKVFPNKHLKTKPINTNRPPIGE